LKLNRRAFFCTAAAVVPTLCGVGCARESTEPRGTLVDFHVHLFGVGDNSKCFLSDKQKAHVNYRLFLRLLGLKENGTLDRDYVAELIRQLANSRVDRALLFAQDGRYDRNGKLDRDNTHVYVPNDYLFEVVDLHPDRLLACASINPQRRDALDELQKCVGRGARAIKVHPPTQNVDPSDKRFRPFYRKIAEQGILLIVHTGMEHATDVVGHHLSRPSKLEIALQEGCTVIAAHAGMGAFFDSKDFFDELIDLVPRYPNLYCDSAVLASMFRWRNLARILENSGVLDRLVHASDYPFPSNALVFWNRLHPSKLLELCSESNIFERDFQLKRALGLPTACFERGAFLLGV
jgi:predicted TIM-barrel fold metal-dependent hydrolase